MIAPGDLVATYNLRHITAYRTPAVTAGYTFKYDCGTFRFGIVLALIKVHDSHWDFSNVKVTSALVLDSVSMCCGWVYASFLDLVD